MFQIYPVRIENNLYEVFVGGARTVSKIVKQNKNGTSRVVWNLGDKKSPLAQKIEAIAKVEYELS